MRSSSATFRKVFAVVLAGLLLITMLLAFFGKHNLPFYYKMYPTPFRPHIHYVATGSGYHLVGDMAGVGGAVAYRVGPGRATGSQLLYISYKYYGGTFDLVGVDPYTGDFSVHTSPIKSEWGANAMVVGLDGNVYLGTLPHAHLIRYDPRTDTITDMGQPSLTEQYIWDATLGADNKIYAVTYPHAKLIRFDPVTQEGVDLGRLDPQQQYARYIVASSDGFLYTSIGSARTTVVAYNIATGEHRAILPYHEAGFVSVFTGRDNNIYAQLPDSTAYRLTGWAAIPIAPYTLPPVKAAATLHNGNNIGVIGNTLRIYRPDGQVISSRTYPYKGKGMQVFRIALGPDGNLYGSTILPAYLLRVDITARSIASAPIENLGVLPYAEVYSFEKDAINIYMAGYGYTYPLIAYTPTRPMHLPDDLVTIKSFTYDDWRPEAMIQGPNHQLFIGAIPGYGKLGGVLVVWNTSTNSVEAYPQVVTDESPISLTFADGKLIGGTTIYGGEGSVPTQTNAKLFVWDPGNRSTMFETVPVPGATTISNLITTPNGSVYGIAGRTLFTFDPVREKIAIIGNMAIPSTAYVYDAGLLSNVAIGSDGNIWGLSTSGVFKINVKTNTIRVIPSPVPITGGFAFVTDKVDGDRLYFASGSRVFIYFLPR